MNWQPFYSAIPEGIHVEVTHDLGGEPLEDPEGIETDWLTPSGYRVRVIERDVVKPFYVALFLEDAHPIHDVEMRMYAEKAVHAIRDMRDESA